MSTRPPPPTLPDADQYIVCSMSNSPYQQWQSDLLEFSARASGQEGKIVRLCSMDDRFPRLAPARSTSGYTLVTPSFADVKTDVTSRATGALRRLLGREPDPRNHFYCLNKPYSMRAFLRAHPGLDAGTRLLWLDPDMVIVRAWDTSALDVTEGRVVGQHWWYYDPRFATKNGAHEHQRFQAPESRALMFPFCMTVGDMRRIVDSFCRFTRELYIRTGAWESEMYALVMAMSEAGLEVRTIPALATCNNWPGDLPDDPDACMTHYCQPMNDADGRRVWWKRQYTAGTMTTPWQRPPSPSRTSTLTDHRTLSALHRFIDWQESGQPEGVHGGGAPDERSANRS
ncbi:MAG: hypothetical protein ACYTCU_02225 [Planctomycetota bacterium]